MFCNQCGTPLQPDYNLCPKCGQPVARTVVAPVAGGDRLQRHLRTLGILWIVVGALFLLPALAVGVFGTAATMFFMPFHNAFAHNLGPFVMLMAGGTLFIMGAGGICTGWALIERRPWARIVAIVLGVLALIRFPLGTALGIYTLWVLLSNDAEAQYQRLSRIA